MIEVGVVSQTQHTQQAQEFLNLHPQMPRDEFKLWSHGVYGPLISSYVNDDVAQRVIFQPATLT